MDLQNTKQIHSQFNSASCGNSCNDSAAYRENVVLVFKKSSLTTFDLTVWFGRLLISGNVLSGVIV